MDGCGWNRGCQQPRDAMRLQVFKRNLIYQNPIRQIGKQQEQPQLNYFHNMFKTGTN